MVLELSKKSTKETYFFQMLCLRLSSLVTILEQKLSILKCYLLVNRGLGFFRRGSIDILIREREESGGDIDEFGGFGGALTSAEVQGSVQGCNYLIQLK